MHLFGISEKSLSRMSNHIMICGMNHIHTVGPIFRHEINEISANPFHSFFHCVIECETDLVLCDNWSEF